VISRSALHQLPWDHGLSGSVDACGYLTTTHWQRRPKVEQVKQAQLLEHERDQLLEQELRQVLEQEPGRLRTAGVTTQGVK